MNMNATLIGQAVIVLAIVFALIGYYLGKRKTDSPKLIATLAMLSGLIPPIGLIFLLVLACKPNKAIAQ